jgi:phenylalanyl-tRNA synthetase alpha subunit
MIDEVTNIEQLKEKINELQKRIKLNYLKLNDGDLEPDERSKISLEINVLQKRIVKVQSELRTEYLQQAGNAKRVKAGYY